MNRCRRIACAWAVIVVTMVVMTTAENTQRPGVELLWPQGAPGAKGDAPRLRGDKLAPAEAGGDKPTLTIYLPSHEIATGSAVVICPGGGYGFLAIDHEGHQIAQWLNSLGVAGFILKYRHRNSGAGYGHPAPLQDAQRAIRLVRSQAKKWNIDPNRIGIIGFSAGGHLASSVGTHFQNSYYDVKDSIDQVSPRPDFMILAYPVISFSKWCAHTGSRTNLLGQNPDQELVNNLSNEEQVTSQTPPTFLVHANDDKGVPPENSIYFYLALRKAEVPVEMHIYENGGHGFGLGKKDSPAASWPLRCADWMRNRGLLERNARQK